MSQPSLYADTLNELDEMARTMLYAMRKATLVKAERIIVQQERQINELKELLTDLYYGRERTCGVCHPQETRDACLRIKEALAKGSPLRQCPECGRHAMSVVLIRAFATKFEGKDITVPDAQVSHCNGCGAEYYSAKELKRWRKIANGN